MDRAADVDRVDGPEVSVEPNDSGLDAYAVWRERVHGARAGERVSPREARTAANEPTGAGWDPLDTWRRRVHRARAGAGSGSAQ